MSFKLFCCLCYILGILVVSFTFELSDNTKMLKILFPLKIIIKAKPQNFANSGITSDSSIKQQKAKNPITSKVKRGNINKKQFFK